MTSIFIRKEKEGNIWFYPNAVILPTAGSLIHFFSVVLPKLHRKGGSTVYEPVYFSMLDPSLSGPSPSVHVIP